MKPLVNLLLLSLPYAAAAQPAAAQPAAAQSAPDSPRHWLSFSIDRSGSLPVHYGIRLEEGTGHGFYSMEGTASSDAAPSAAAAASKEVPISVDEPTLKKLLVAVPFVKAHRCETHAKHLAQTGTKTLRYAGDGAVAECTYNYSDDDRVNTATSLFLALGETLQYGDRLAAKLRFDRLGLDAEVASLQSALDSGQAMQVGNIAPVLEAIQNDERVMERVRRKAARLLEGAGIAPAQASAGKDGSSDR